MPKRQTYGLSDSQRRESRRPESGASRQQDFHFRGMAGLLEATDGGYLGGEEQRLWSSESAGVGTVAFRDFSSLSHGSVRSNNLLLEKHQKKYNSV